MNFLEKFKSGRGKINVASLEENGKETIHETTQKPQHTWESGRTMSEEEKLRMLALENSHVSDLIRQLSDSPQVQIEEPSSWYPTVYIKDEKFKGQGEKFDRIPFVGREDGSVLIGYYFLSRKEARNPDLVSEAFIKAWQTAESVYVNPQISTNA